MILVYCPCKDEGEAKRISEALVKEKLVACTNTFPIRSCYFWEGMKDDAEHVFLAKTFEENVPAVEKRIRELHSYDVPCIARISADVNKEYADWARKEIQ